MSNIIGFTAGTFDLLHAGHITMLEEAKEQCDYLICGLQLNPNLDRKDKNVPIQTIVERYIQLKAVRYVDEIIPYNTEKELEDILSLYNIDVRIIGEEYYGKKFTGDVICVNRGIELYYNNRNHSFSSTNLRKNIYQKEKERLSTIELSRI